PLLRNSYNTFYLMKLISASCANACGVRKKNNRKAKLYRSRNFIKGNGQVNCKTLLERGSSVDSTSLNARKWRLLTYFNSVVPSRIYNFSFLMKKKGFTLWSMIRLTIVT